MKGDDKNGNDVVAIFPMLENNLCQLLVFDFDNHAKGAEQEDHANEDENWNAYEDQLKVLAGTKRLTKQEIEDYLSLWYSGSTSGEDDDSPWDKT